jgi:signal transduction histidine kinase
MSGPPRGRRIRRKEDVGRRPDAYPSNVRHAFALRSRFTGRGDLVLALVAVAVTQLAVWTGTVRGPHPANAVLLLAVTAAVGVKSRWPVGATVWVAGVLSVQVALYGASETAGLMFTFLGLAYTLASRCTGRRLLAGLGVLLAVGLWHEARDDDIHSFVDALFTPIVIAVAATLGFAVAQARARAELAERQATAAEAARVQAEQLVAGQERERIARELHDVLAHTVSVMVVQAEAAEEMLEHEPARAREPVTAVQRVGREALVEIRSLLQGLRQAGEETRAPQPGVADVGALVRAAADAGQRVGLHEDGTPQPVPASTGAAVYRVVQEALTNARKHAPGAQVDVHLQWQQDALAVTVTDDGSGAAVTDGQPAHGFGLIGMRERAHVLGGTLEVGDDGGAGFRVSAVLPIAERP